MENTCTTAGVQLYTSCSSKRQQLTATGLTVQTSPSLLPMMKTRPIFEMFSDKTLDDTQYSKY